MQKEVKVIREKKEVAQKNAKIQKKKAPKPTFAIGNRVRLHDGKAVGTIDALEKGKAIVNYGLFTTNVSITQLELVEK